MPLPTRMMVTRFFANLLSDASAASALLQTTQGRQLPALMLPLLSAAVAGDGGNTQLRLAASTLALNLAVQLHQVQ